MLLSLIIERAVHAITHADEVNLAALSVDLNDLYQLLDSGALSTVGRFIVVVFTGATTRVAGGGDDVIAAICLMRRIPVVVTANDGNDLIRLVDLVQNRL